MATVYRFVWKTRVDSVLEAKVVHFGVAHLLECFSRERGTAARGAVQDDWPILLARGWALHRKSAPMAPRPYRKWGNCQYDPTGSAGASGTSRWWLAPSRQPCCRMVELEDVAHFRNHATPAEFSLDPVAQCGRRGGLAMNDKGFLRWRSKAAHPSQQLI